MPKIIDIRKTIPKHPTKRYKKRSVIKKIVVHCTASNNQDPEKTARYHVEHLGWPGLGYHDFITDKGIVFHCNSYDRQTYHARSWNSTSVGIVIAYKGEQEPPSEKQMKSLEEQLTRLCLFMTVSPKMIVGHREAPWVTQVLGNGSIRYKKTCPGMAIDLDRLRKQVALRLQRKLAAEMLYNHRLIDGIWGPRSQQALIDFKDTLNVQK